MTVPSFQNLMLPLLNILGDQREHTLGEVIDALAVRLDLSEDERRALLASGKQSRFDNRVGWARTYLKKAGLLESTGRGRFRITERGLHVLRDNPREISVRFLKQFPEFLEFQSVSRRGARDEGEETIELNQTPEEVLESSYQNLRLNLAQDLLERVKNSSPRFFENLVIDLLVAMGYGGSRQDAEAVGRSGDGGIDGIIKEDKLGLDVVYVQAKKWEGTVGRPTVQAFAGSLEGQRARKGVLITTSQFSPEAKEYVNRIEKRIVLMDGEQLAQFMIDHNLGVTEVASYVVKKVDLDYFGEE